MIGYPQIAIIIVAGFLGALFYIAVKQIAIFVWSKYVNKRR
jgi:hypothetical protein